MSDSNNFRSNVKNITNDKKSRILLLGAGAIVIGGVVFAFAPGAGRGPSSSLPSAPTTGGAPGIVQVNPEMERALQTEDARRFDEAKRTGTSSLPTPIVKDLSNRVNSIFGNREERGTEPPEPPAPVELPPTLALPSAQTPVSPDRAQGTQQNQGPQQPPGPPPLDQALIQAMQAQMRAMLNVPIKPSETVYLYHPQTGAGNAGMGNTTTGSTSGSSAQAALAAGGFQGGNDTAAGRSGMQNQNAPMAAQTSYVRPSRFAAPATGTILFSRLIGRINSDVPGPVVAEITQGPLSGSRLIGSFQFTEEGVIIQFSSMTVPFTDDGLERTEVVPINAVAVDPENLGTAMSTSIDRRVLERIAFGFATAFVQGLGQAISQSGSSTTLSPGGATYSAPVLNTRDQLLTASGSAAGVAGKILDQTFGKRRTTIVVEANTPFGLLFMGSGSGSTNAGQ